MGRMGCRKSAARTQRDRSEQPDSSAHAIEANKLRVEEDISVLSSRSWLVGRPPEVSTIVGDERPVAIDNNLLQFPIFEARFADPDNVRTLHKATADCEFYKLWAQAFIDKKCQQLRPL